MLWKNKTSPVEILTNIIQLNKLIFIWLQKKKLNVLDIDYKLKQIHIFVYSQFFISRRIKFQIIKMYKKKLKLNSVVQKFGLTKKQLIAMLNFNRVKVNEIFKRYKNVFWNISFLLLKKWLRTLLRVNTKALKNKYKKFEIFFFKDNVCFYTFLHSSYRRLQANFFGKLLLIRKMNGFLKGALISKVLQHTLFLLINKDIQIKINNIWLRKGVPRLPLFGDSIKQLVFRYNFFTLYLALVYKNSKLVADYLSEAIKKDKQHRKTLQKCTDSIEKIFFSKLLFLSGMQIRVTGKLGGKMRRSKYHYKLGTVQLQTLKHFVSYSCLPVYTKFGLISIKVWLVQQNESKGL
jgi:hypothetical protein